MIEDLLIHSLVVFAITLTITKSKIMACKRKFVVERYEYAKTIKKPSFIHEWWKAVFTCSMCCGFWVALITAPFFPKVNIIFETLSAYGLNWIFHCIENWLYWAGKAYELSESEKS